MKLYRPVGNKTLIPVGMVIFTYTKTNPSTWFGGTWEQLSGGYLYLCASSTEKTTYTGLNTQAASGNTGNCTLTTNQIPSHNHYCRAWFHGYSGWSGTSQGNSYVYNWSSTNCIVNQNSSNVSGPVQLCAIGESLYSGGGGSHNHSLNSHTHNIATVGFFAWRRTA